MKAILAKKQEQEAEARRSLGSAQQGGTPCGSSEDTCQASCSGDGSSPTSSARASRAPQNCAATAACPCDYSACGSSDRFKAPGWGGCRQGSRRCSSSTSSGDGCSAAKRGGKAAHGRTSVSDNAAQADGHRAGTGKREAHGGPPKAPAAAPVAPAPPAPERPEIAATGPTTSGRCASLRLSRKHQSSSLLLQPLPSHQKSKRQNRRLHLPCQLRDAW